MPPYFFKALADPIRRAILEQLELVPVAVSDLAKPFETTMPTVLHHLKVLEACGLVSSDKPGRVRTYSLNIHGFERLSYWFERRRTRGKSILDRTGDKLAGGADLQIDLDQVEG